MLNVYVIYVCPISHLRLIYNGFNTRYTVSLLSKDNTTIINEERN